MLVLLAWTGVPAPAPMLELAKTPVQSHWPYSQARSKGFIGSYLDLPKFNDLNNSEIFRNICHGWIRLRMRIVYCTLSAFTDIQTSIL